MKETRIGDHYLPTDLVEAFRLNHRIKNLKSVQLGDVILPGSKDTRELVELFKSAPADMVALTVYQFRRLYFLARHQNALRSHAHLYEQALHALGAEVRFATIDEVRLHAD